MMLTRRRALVAGGRALAAIRSPEEFAAVSVVSPALWTSPGDTAGGVYDDG
jgi:enterochelin esterase-like enzyme